MKYKKIELIESGDSDAELLCSVEFENPRENEELVDDLTDELIDLFESFENEIEIEPVTTDIISVRCWEINFNREGVNLLTKMYNRLVNADFNTIQPKIFIGVHIDGEEWFKREDGSEYNEDTVTLEEFISNLEYR